MRSLRIPSGESPSTSEQPRSAQRQIPGHPVPGHPWMRGLSDCLSCSWERITGDFLGHSSALGGLIFTGSGLSQGLSSARGTWQSALEHSGEPWRSQNRPLDAPGRKQRNPPWKQESVAKGPERSPGLRARKQGAGATFPGAQARKKNWMAGFLMHQVAPKPGHPTSTTVTAEMPQKRVLAQIFVSVACCRPAASHNNRSDSSTQSTKRDTAQMENKESTLARDAKTSSCNAAIVSRFGHAFMGWIRAKSFYLSCELLEKPSKT